MVNQTEKVILRDSPEAAQPVTVIGWKSSTGRVFFDEYSARYDGATHCICSDCGEIARKPYTVCKPCQNLRDEAKYKAMPKKEWDGHAMLYSDLLEKYYSGISEAMDDLDNSNEVKTIADLRLVICEPNYARQIDGDYFVDDLPDDAEGDLPGWLEEAIDEFNTAVSKGGPLSWSPGKFALKLEDGE